MKYFSKKYDAVVLGAGVAGLAFAWEFSQKGKKVLVLEKENKVGGLHRTTWYKGFGFDFCAHRFHTANQKLLKRVKKLMGKDFIKKQKQSRIFLFNKFLRYPFEIPQLLRAMPKKQAFYSIFEFVLARVKTKLGKPKIKNYKEWFEYFFGRGLYNVMCRPYTSKIWKMDPVKLSADWADQRFKGIKTRELIKETVKKILTLNFRSEKIEDELFPDAAPFYYPKEGAYKLAEKMAEKVIENKGVIKTNVSVTKITSAKAGKKIKFSLGNKKYSVFAPFVISTIPLHATFPLISPKPPTNISKALNKLRYLNTIFVNLILKKSQVSKDSWLYFPEKEIIFNRLVEFKNWSPKMAPVKNKTAVNLDISCYRGNKIWDASDDYLIDKALKGGEKAGLFSKKDLFGGFVIRVPFAYPVYDLGYKKRVKKIVNFIEKDKKIFCLGRTGLFRWNNADNSIEMGFELANRLLNKSGDTSLLSYSFKAFSL